MSRSFVCFLLCSIFNVINYWNGTLNMKENIAFTKTEDHSNLHLQKSHSILTNRAHRNYFCLS